MAKESTPPPVFEGKVTHVSDGDTFKFNFQGLELTVRLAEVDSPEKAQPYGDIAKAALTKLILNKTVKVSQQAKDRYGRIVGHVHSGRTFVNQVMLEEGHVWAYSQYLENPEFPKIQEKAKRAKLGLWALPKAQQVPPWEWREKQREKEAALSPSGTTSTTTTSSSKPTGSTSSSSTSSAPKKTTSTTSSSTSSSTKTSSSKNYSAPVADNNQDLAKQNRGSRRGRFIIFLLIMAGLAYAGWYISN